MRVHPAYTLSNDARLFLCSLTREILSEGLCRAVHRAASPVNLVGGRTGCGCICGQGTGRYALISAKGKRQVLFRLAVKEGSAERHLCALTDTQNNVQTKWREKKHLLTLSNVCERLRIDKKKTVFVYAGRLVHDGATPRKLGMDSDSGEMVQVFAVPQKWWIFKQREQARKGLLTSVKSIDVSKIVNRANSKVDNTASKDALKQLSGFHTSSSHRKSSSRRRKGSNAGGRSDHVEGKLSTSNSDSRFRSRLQAPKYHGKPRERRIAKGQQQIPKPLH